MSERRIQVFSGDLTLAPYLANYLQNPTCTVLEENGKFYLCSSYFEALPHLPTAAERARLTSGINAVLELAYARFDTLPLPMKQNACIDAILSVLNGMLKLKYKGCGGLTRVRVVSPAVVERGKEYEVTNSGKRISTSINHLAGLAIVASGDAFYQNADRRHPSVQKLWDIAGSNAAVARALYHYEKSEDVVELRKVVEEIMTATYTGPAPRRGKVRFPDWISQRWTEPEVGRNTMKEFWAVLHNALLLGEEALHCMPFADPSQVKTSGTNLSLQDARDILDTLLWKWVSSL